MVAQYDGAGAGGGGFWDEDVCSDFVGADFFVGGLD